MFEMRVVLGTIVWLIVLLIFAIPLVILSIFKLVVIAIYCKNSNRNNAGINQDLELLPLSKGDCIIATGSSWTRSKVNVGFVLVVEGKVDVEQFRKHFADCLKIHKSNDKVNEKDFWEKSYSRLFSYIDTRYGYVFRACSKSSLNLSELIVKRKLKPIRRNGKNEGWDDSASDNDTESLEEFLAKWMLEDYRVERPCWEVAIIPIPEMATAIAFKIHHGLCDGYSLLHIIDKLTGATSPYLVKNFKEKFCSQLKQILEAPLNLKRLSGLPPELNPFIVPERKYKWMYSFTSFSLEDLKLLRRNNGGVHMTSVIWTVVSGALRRYLSGEAREIPVYTKVGNTLPWPRHPAMDPETRNDDKICNHWVAGIFQIPLRETHPLLRLQEIEKEYVSYLSQGLDKLQMQILLPLLWTLPGNLLESVLTKDLGVVGGLTSLIGANSYNLLGFAVKNIHPILAIHDNAPYLPLSCFTFSHSGKMELTMGANPLSIIKNKQALDMICHKYCHEEIANFLAVTNKQL